MSNEAGYPPPPPPGGPSEPLKKKNWFLRHKILSVIGALIVLGIIGAAAGGGGDKEESDKLATATTAPPTTAAVPSAAAPPAAAAPAVPEVTYAGKLKGDKLASTAGEVQLSGWTTTASPLVRKKSELQQKVICSEVTLTNRDKSAQDYNGTSWTMQTPGGSIQNITFSGDRDISFASLAPGGVLKNKQVCFEDTGEGAGQYILAWQPDLFSSKDRGVWLNAM